ncbi:uncharacterized protein LOC134537831 [Bacillus rossius redtenbacheri]|uniref:uncharacterized protein LOC134537831 n=1 Tax=Bacillus rossius redtenbacheri TaxID=93214 RepID=UPI002FDE7BED
MGVCRDCCWETHSCHTCSRPYQSSQSVQMQSRGTHGSCSDEESVERVFSVWKQRFPCLQLVLRNKLQTTAAIIVVCAICHSIGIRHNDYMEEAELQATMMCQSHQFLCDLGAPWPSGTSSSSGISFLLLPPVMAPLKCSVLPLSGNVQFQPLVCQLCAQSSVIILGGHDQEHSYMQKLHHIEDNLLFNDFACYLDKHISGKLWANFA